MYQIDQVTVLREQVELKESALEGIFFGKCDRYYYVLKNPLL